MNLNQENIKKIRGLVLFTVVIYVLGINYDKILSMAGTLAGMAFPFLMGAAIAFILNVPMRRIEQSLMPKKVSGWKRPLSLCLALAFVLSILMVVIFVVAPQLSGSVISLQESIPAFIIRVQKSAEELFSQNDSIVQYINSIQVDWDSMFNKGIAFLTQGATSVLTTTISAAASIVSGFAMFGIGFVFAIYILLQKENLARQITKLLRAFLPDYVTKRTLEIGRLTEKTFSSFLTGQCVEAVVLGVMFFITLIVLRLPYALLIGVLIAFTALIPIFGAFIGCAVGVFLMLLTSPIDALIFLLVFLILQQIEGNLIYPHVVGNSVGLPSIWVLVAVTIGGSAMGIVGMLIFIPLCSVMYSLLRDEVNARLKKRTLAELKKKVEKNEKGSE